jgi:hypothetical protein
MGVSDEYTAFVFRVEEYAQKETRVKAGGKQAYIPENSFLHNHLCGNLKYSHNSSTYVIITISLKTWEAIILRLRSSGLLTQCIHIFTCRLNFQVVNRL